MTAQPHKTTLPCGKVLDNFYLCVFLVLPMAQRLRRHETQYSIVGIVSVRKFCA